MRPVTVVIPSFNTSVYLRDCVESVRKNTAGVNTEIIIVNDVSTDETTLRVLRELESDEDLIVITHETNQGVQAARNTGLEAASGDYVVCVDADDVLLPISGKGSFLSEATKLLEQDPEIAFVHTMSRMFGDFEGLTIGSYPLREELAVRKHHVMTSIVYRRTELAQGLKYNPAVRKWQDWAFGVSLLARRSARNEGTKIGFVKGPGFGYRIHDTGPRISRAPAFEVDAAKPVIEEYLEYFASKFPEVARDVDSLATAVVACKPSALIDLLHMAAFDLEQALGVVKPREYQLISAEVTRLDIP